MARRLRTGRGDTGHLVCLYCRACSCLHSSAASAQYRSRPRSCALIGRTLDQQRLRPKQWPAPDRRRELHRASCSSRWIGAGHDHPIELQDLLLDPAQLSSECQETRTGHFRNSLVVWIGDDIEQLLDTVTPDRRNDPELGKMGPDCIDHRGLLTDEQMAGAMEHQATLLFRGLGWYKAHVGPGDCLANGLRVSRIVLLPLDVGLHIGRWAQPHG